MVSNREEIQNKEEIWEKIKEERRMEKFSILMFDIIESTNKETEDWKNYQLHLEIISKKIVEAYDGHFWSQDGDKLTYGFLRVEDAVRVAISIEKYLTTFNEIENNPKQKMELRMGIHTGRIQYTDPPSNISDENMNITGHLIKKSISVPSILITQDVYYELSDELKDYFHEVSGETIKGKKVYAKIDFVKRFFLKPPRPRDPGKFRSITRKERLRILAIGAHAHDIELGCGGTLMYLKDQVGAEIYYRVFTTTETGRLGILDATCDVSREIYISSTLLLNGFKKGDVDTKLIEVTTAKAQKALLDEANRSMLDTKRRVSSIIGDNIINTQIDTQISVIRGDLRKLQVDLIPHIIFVPSIFITHQDDKTLGMAAIQIFRRQESIWHYELPHFSNNPVRQFNPNLFIDVSRKPRDDGFYRGYSSYAEAKLDLLKIFQGSMGKKWWFGEEIFKSHMIRRALESYSPKYHYENEELLPDAFVEAFEANLFF